MNLNMKALSAMGGQSQAALVQLALLQQQQQQQVSHHHRILIKSSPHRYLIAFSVHKMARSIRI